MKTLKLTEEQTAAILAVVAPNLPRTGSVECELVSTRAQSNHDEFSKISGRTASGLSVPVGCDATSGAAAGQAETPHEKTDEEKDDDRPPFPGAEKAGEIFDTYVEDCETIGPEKAKQKARAACERLVRGEEENGATEEDAP